MEIQTPPNIRAIVSAGSPTYKRLALLCDEITVNLQVDYNYIDPAVFYTQCRSCEYLTHNRCLGGYEKISSFSCAKNLSEQVKTKYVRKTIPPHVVFIDRYLDYSLYVVEDQKDSGDMRLSPMLLGNVRTSGELCRGSMNVQKHNFCDYYSKIWSLKWTGDYNYSDTTIDQLIENWSPDWQRKHYRYGVKDFEQLQQSLFNLLSISDLNECTVYPPGKYDINRRNYGWEDDDEITPGYDLVHSKIEMKAL